MIEYCRGIKELKEKSGMRLTVKVSVLEIAGPKEELRDLLLSLRGHDQHGQGQCSYFIDSLYLSPSVSLSVFLSLYLFLR